MIKLDFEISQIGTIVDNTIKTRYIFEINKGGNINPSIDVNASIEKNDRRILWIECSSPMALATFLVFLL